MCCGDVPQGVSVQDDISVGVVTGAMACTSENTQPQTTTMQGVVRDEYSETPISYLCFFSSTDALLYF